MAQVRIPKNMTSITLSGDGVLAPTNGVIACSALNATSLCRDVFKSHVRNTAIIGGAGPALISPAVTAFTINGNTYNSSGGQTDILSAIDLTQIVYEGFILVAGDTSSVVVLNGGVIANSATSITTANFTSTSGASGGTAPYTYQWQRKTTGAFADIGGATNATLNDTGLNPVTTYHYQRVAHDSLGNMGISNTIDLTTLDIPYVFGGLYNHGPVTTDNGESLVVTAVNTVQAAVIDANVLAVDCSEIKLQIPTWHLSENNAIIPMSAFDVISIALVIGSTWVQGKFSGSNTVHVPTSSNACLTDSFTPAMFGLTKFAAGTVISPRYQLQYAAALTDHSPRNRTDFRNIYNPTNLCVKFDPLKAVITAGILDSTIQIGFNMINGGINGVDLVAYVGFCPIIIVKPLVAHQPSFYFSGNSEYDGALDTGSAADAFGLSRNLFIDKDDYTKGGYCGCNFGCDGSRVLDIFNAPALTHLYSELMVYANILVEGYGTNPPWAIADSEAIHALGRAAGCQWIIRTSLYPLTSSSNDWIDAGGQTIAGGYGPGSAVDTKETALRALAATQSDYVYFDFGAVRDAGNYWKWRSDGSTADLYTSEGEHLTGFAYNQAIVVDTTHSNVIKQSGTTQNSFQGFSLVLPVV